jgi:lincosamide nucleotidyltransferase
MTRKEALLQRLEAIGQSLERSSRALALLGLGSVGKELERLDSYSDLDFFAIVQPGCKADFINDLSWLNAVQPIAYSFLNTPDGHKVLFEDGLFAEFAVFEPDDLARIPFAEGRIVWKMPDFDETLLKPAPQRPRSERPLDWYIGEIVTNLYVGMERDRRGERLSAFNFIQQYAVARLVEITQHIETEQPAFPDPFAPERRYEQRFPGMVKHLADFMQGYNRNAESARAILEFLDASFLVNPRMKQQILMLCGDPLQRD